jgi:HD-GYP domain-containing protein (c-di-GMP phosphodiesterase class II)
MLKIPVDKITSGMKLAQTLYRTVDGKILLAENCRLKSSYIPKLKEYEIRHVYIQDPEEDKEEEFLQPIREETRTQSINILKEINKQVKNNGTFNIEALNGVVISIINYILEDSRLVYNMIEIETHDSYTLSHSVNVCVLSALIGTAMGLRRRELEILCIGAILHDIGKNVIDAELLNKPGSLEPSEYEIFKEHARKGYEIIKKNVQISFLPAHTAFQHHEREDGSGYPRGLTTKSIHQFSEIVAVADVYDAMTSNRAYKRAYPSHIAIQELVNNSNTKYSCTVVEHFLKVVAPYPVGSVLLLSSGEEATVINVSRSKCIAATKSGLDERKKYDLYKLNDISIVGRLK